MFNYTFPNWLPISFFIILLVASFAVGKWLERQERKYKGF